MASSHVYSLLVRIHIGCEDGSIRVSFSGGFTCRKLRMLDYACQSKNFSYTPEIGNDFLKSRDYSCCIKQQILKVILLKYALAPFVNS